MATDLTITPPHGYRKVAYGPWTWADAGCDDCDGTGIVWTTVRDDGVPLYREDSDCACVWTPDEDVDELNRRYQSWGSPDRARDAWERIAEALGPRRPGGWYWSGYWYTGYTVVSISYTFHDGDPASPSWKITVQWDAGHRTTHHTPWDARGDSCHRPSDRWPGPAPVPPELRFTATSGSRWARLTSCLRRRR